jgi:Cof subfamily protein (haloacid dehalogenase superfamily)
VLPPGLDVLRLQACFLDLDGTVLADGRPLPGAREAIVALEETGVRCVIATGRMLTSTRRIAADLGIEGLVICYQGAMVGDTDGAILSHHPLDEQTAREVLVAILDHGFDPIAFIDEKVYVARESDAARAYSENAGVPYHVVGDIVHWLPAPVTKLVTIGTPEEMDHLRDAILPLYGERAFIAKSLPHFLEIAASGTSKATGCSMVCGLTGIDPADTIAFGDGENDIEMLQWAHYSVAVGGGFERLMRLADWVCPPLAEAGVPQTLRAIASARTELRA